VHEAIPAGSAAYGGVKGGLLTITRSLLAIKEKALGEPAPHLSRVKHRAGRMPVQHTSFLQIQPVNGIAQPAHRPPFDYFGVREPLREAVLAR
jgi:hypothetical protein